MRTAQGSFFFYGPGQEMQCLGRGGAGQEKNVQGVVKQHVNWNFIRQEITKKTRSSRFNCALRGDDADN